MLKILTRLLLLFGGMFLFMIACDLLAILCRRKYDGAYHEFW